MPESRAFSTLQRVEIFNRSGGNCQRCGCDITLSNFHADHIIPWSQSGKTQVSNGQALCPPCNLKKSGTMDLNYKIHLPPHLTPARAWQDDFLKRFFASALRQLSTTPAEIKPLLGHYDVLGPKVAAEIPGCTYVHFPLLGHAPQIQDPASFHAALLNWLP